MMRLTPMLRNKEKLVVIGVITHCFIFMVFSFVFICMHLESMENSVLLVVSPQKCFIKGQEFPMKNLNEIIPKVNGIMYLFHTVVYVSEMHAPKHVSFASGYSKMNKTKLAYNPHNGKLCYAKGWLEQVEESKCRSDSINSTITLVPEHCLEGTEGVKLHSKLVTNKSQSSLFFTMGKNRYRAHSGPFDTSCHQHNSTNITLISVLKERDLTDVYLTGIYVNNALYHTISQALKLGLRPFIVQDAITSNHPHYLQNIKEDSDLHLSEKFYVTYASLTRK